MKGEGVSTRDTQRRKHCGPAKSPRQEKSELVLWECTGLLWKPTDRAHSYVEDTSAGVHVRPQHRSGIPVRPTQSAYASGVRNPLAPGIYESSVTDCRTVSRVGHEGTWKQVLGVAKKRPHIQHVLVRAALCPLGKVSTCQWELCCPHPPHR